MQAITEWFNNLLLLIQTFRFADLVDIVIIAVLIYGVLRLVQDTRAEQLLKGIVFILFVYALATIFRLTMLTAILKTFLDVAVIIVFIIFQPEIRKALEHLGRSKITKGYLSRLIQSGFAQSDDQDNINKAISDVADTAVVFSHAKVGALIVFERETKLTDIATTGVILNADTSTALFGNIFFNTAPLHDGACIIREGRIFAAGCILPLNSKEVNRKDIGTRHRAAIGVSEVSDAMVVVVSEETGKISVAINGTLTSNYDRDTLVTVLEDYLIPKEIDTEKLSKFKIKRGKKSNEE